MNNHITTFIAACTLVLVPYLALLSYLPRGHHDSIKIAILTPTTHAALEEIERGFKEKLRERGGKNYSFTTFNAHGNQSLLRAQAEEIVTSNYDLIFTIGAHCSQSIAHLAKKKGCKTPHVFGAIDGYKFAQSIQSLNTSTTGVYVQVDYERTIDELYKLKPDVKNILLVYDPTQGTGLEEHHKRIAAHVKKFNAQLQSVVVYHPNEIQGKTASLLPGVDVVFVLIDNTVVAGIDVLITLCNRHGVTLLASDLESGKKGASLAYGITEYESGSAAAQKAYAIVVEGDQPNMLPISAVDGFRMEVNKNIMTAQSLMLDRAGKEK